ncbi:MAG TPA: gamma-glutamyl-gamma-aminobutyrate hydrolase family protein [Gemmatimonadaceae bacterium]|nr:gamma-glutamyl-gamma-aminobutyrate hydrolase family protein [Gemmatimonadaceae bacterium]
MSSAPLLPLVGVTASTESVRGRPRVLLNRAYTDAVAAAGLAPLVLPPLDAALAPDVLRGVGGLVLTGGEDVAPRRYGAAPHPTVQVHEERDAFELALVATARTRGIPTLAICRGEQLVNVALGGTLVQDIPSERVDALAHDPKTARDARVHEVRVAPGSTLAAALQAACLATNSSHHQAIDRLGDGLRVVGRTADGIIEAVESTDPHWWMIGVQWHPEELIATTEEWDRRLFAAFAARVRAPAERGTDG